LKASKVKDMTKKNTEYSRASKKSNKNEGNSES